MSIIRAPRPESNWYNLDKRISEDGRLSWAARGVLIFLLGKPDHWEVSVKHLINQTKDAAGKSSGRDAIRVILKELEVVGYLKADIARGEGGAFNGMAYTVCELPEESRGTDYPAPAKPATAKPAPDKPTPDNPHQVKTERKQHTDSPVRTDLELLQAGSEEPASDGLEGDLLPAKAQAPKTPVAAEKPRVEIPVDMPGPKDQECKTYKTWANYAFTYRKRYGVWPLWNKSVGVKIGAFIDRVGAESAPKIAAFFVSDNDSFVVKGGHSVGTLLQNAEKYHTAWQTGRTVTSAEAHQIDKTQTNLNAAEQAEELIRARYAARRSANAN